MAKCFALSSLALISARATITSTEVLSMLVATYLYLLCQGKDLTDLWDTLLIVYL
jgi:phenylalanine ammonia-lyase